MQPVTYNYPSRFRTTKWFLLVYCVFVLIIFFYYSSDNGKVVGLFLAAVVFFDVALFWNMYPEIVLEEDGLLVHFFFWWLPVKWQDIVDVKLDFVTRITSNWPGIFRNNRLYIVKARSLTFFHRFYDRRFFSFSPTFYIYSKICGFEELLSIFENKNLIQTREKLAV
jgi:hypothetical protein